MILGILPDHEIRRSVVILPFSEGQKRKGVISYGVSGYGYDARVGHRFKMHSPILGGVIVDPKAMDEKAYQIIEGDSCTIPANHFVLAESMEWFEIPRDVIAICLGKSTYARCGIVVNVTPLEPEWKGKITIEISNTNPLPAKIYAGEGIMQILFFRAASQCETSYADKAGKYDNQQGLTLAKVD